MFCPDCGAKGSRTVVTLDTAYNAKDDEFYRKRKCRSCQHIFYTVEYEVPFDDAFKRKWDLINPPEEAKIQASRQRFRTNREFRKNLSKTIKE